MENLAVTVSDNQADGGGVGQCHHGNDAVVAAVLSVNMEVTLVEDASQSYGRTARNASRKPLWYVPSGPTRRSPRCRAC